MTRAEAYRAMIDGKKVTHKYFDDNQYIFMIGQNIYTEDNCSMGTIHDDFWRMRKTESFNDGWEIYKQ
jgi:hypothetical protein